MTYKPRVRYRPGVGYFRVWQFYVTAEIIRTYLIGPYLNIDEAIKE